MKVQIRLMVLLGVMGVTPGLAGGMDSGGGDIHSPSAGTAWFLQKDREVVACLEVASGFGLDNGEIKETVQKGFQKWVDYLNDVIPSWEYYQDFDYANHLNWNEICQGNEDLTFYFGALLSGSEHGIKCKKA